LSTIFTRSSTLHNKKFYSTGVLLLAQLFFFSARRRLAAGKGRRGMPAASRRWGPGELNFSSGASTGLLPKVLSYPLFRAENGRARFVLI